VVGRRGPLQVSDQQISATNSNCQLDSDFQFSYRRLSQLKKSVNSFNSHPSPSIRSRKMSFHLTQSSTPSPAHKNASCNY
jgi:hypothetical protein